MFKKQISLFIATFLIIGFMFLALPENGYSGIPAVPGGPPCCQQGSTCIGGVTAPSACQSARCDNIDCEIIEDAICVEGDEMFTGSCVSPPAVPTLSEWGLIAMAGILGIVGFMVIRRRNIIA